MKSNPDGMKSKLNIVAVLGTLVVAFTILSASVLRSAEIKYAYSPMVLSEKDENAEEKISIDYVLAYPGKVNPDNPIWYLKVIRDRLWYTFTFNLEKKADLSLLFSDKRLNSSLELFKNNKPDLGVVTLSKSEKYLEQAVNEMGTNTDFANKLALSALKHREVIENEILPLTPEDLKPEVIKIGDYSKDAYKNARDLMLSKGVVPPVNPFETN